MLFLPPGTSKLQRLHGSFVSEREVRELVEYLRTQGARSSTRADPHAARRARTRGRAATRTPTSTTTCAVEIVAETRNASISYIQRRLKVGYNRAARMIEQMEREGVVGPQDGMRPREVFVRPARRGRRCREARAREPSLGAGLDRSAAERRGARADGERRRGDCARRESPARVQARYDGMRELDARFVQTQPQRRARRRGGQEMHARGRVLFAKPGRMRWSTRRRSRAWS